MDLDNEELKATREKTSAEMFKELGFTIVEDTDESTIYQCTEFLFSDRCKHNIQFFKDSKSVFSYDDNNFEAMALGIKEVQAIYKYYKEQGWLNE